MSEVIEQSVRQAIPDAITESTTTPDGILTLKVAAEHIRQVCRLLKETPGLLFNYPADITAVDWNDRIEVVYHLTALESNSKVVLRVDLDRDNPVLDSVTPVWKGANWQEREVYDLFGVDFKDHPDMRRILLPEDWKGYPLRKDYVIE